jgi:phenylacetic acid degradation operon negative regulatory protein
VRQIVAVGAIFGFEGNAVRVALARLVRARLVARDDRGSYCLAPGARVVSSFVDAWREGDLRRRAWDGGWLCAWHPRAIWPRERRRGPRALERLGFREAGERLWVRPDNLCARREAVAAELAALGLAAAAELFGARGFSKAMVERWCRTLWPVAGLRRGCARARRDLQRSHARLSRLPREEALVESFLVGGRAIRALALDPLLPDEIAPGDERRRLGEAMLAYDRTGTELWNEYLDAPALEGAPSHVSAA